MAEISLAQYSRLVETIYEAGLDTGKWEDFVAELSQVLDGVYLYLIGWDLQNNCHFDAVTARYSAAALASFDEYYGAINPWMEGLSAIPIGQARAAETFLAREDLFKTEFYNDWIKPQEDIGTGAGIVLHREDDRMLMIASNIRLSEKPEVQKNLVSVLNLIGPHLQKAFHIQRTIGTSELIDHGYRETLDLAANAVILIDAKGRISHANKRAEMLLGAGGMLHVDVSKVLRANDAKADIALAKALHLIKLNDPSRHPGPIMLRGKNGHEPVVATMVPFRPDHDKTRLFSDFLNANLPIAMLTVVDPAQKANPAGQALTMLYLLTRAETELAEALYFGQSLNIYAQVRGISIHTVRNQLKAIFHKTDTKSQSALVALIGRIASV